MEYEPVINDSRGQVPGTGARPVKPGAAMTVEQISANSLRKHMQQSHNMMYDPNQQPGMQGAAYGSQQRQAALVQSAPAKRRR